MVPQARLDLLRLWDLTIPGLTTRGLLDHSKSFDFCVLFGDMNNKSCVASPFPWLFAVVLQGRTNLRAGVTVTLTGSSRASLIPVSGFISLSFFFYFCVCFAVITFVERGNPTRCLLRRTDKAAADANAAAWAAYYAQYQQQPQPQAPMTPTAAAPGTAPSNGQGLNIISYSNTTPPSTLHRFRDQLQKTHTTITSAV